MEKYREGAHPEKRSAHEEHVRRGFLEGHRESGSPKDRKPEVEHEKVNTSGYKE